MISRTSIEMRIEQAKTLPEKVSLNNILAQEVMGWHLDDNDGFRLWLDAEGKEIQVIAENGREYLLCAHPWVEGINKEDHLSFNPVMNQGRNHYDCLELLLSRLN